MWYRPGDKGFSLKAYSASGKLVITETRLVFGEKNETFEIDAREIKSITWGKMPGDTYNEWAIIQYGEPEKVAGFKDGSRLGWGTDTKLIYSTLKSAFERSIPAAKVTLINPKTEQSVTCPEDIIKPLFMTQEQAAQQRAWHADFQRSHNRLPTPMEGCLKVYEILGFVRTATAEPLKPSVAPAERVYTNPVYRWSISYPSSWAVDSADVSFVRITSSTDNALCGIHSGAVPFKTVDEFADTTLANNEQYFRDRGQVFVISARRQISLPNDIAGIDVLTGIGAGGKSRRVYILVDPRGFMIDCETYAKGWDRLEPFYDRIVKSFTIGK